MLAEEQTIDASFSYVADDDSASLDDADATLASLTDDSVLSYFSILIAVFALVGSLIGSPAFAASTPATL